MQLLQRHFRVFHHRAFGHFQLQQGRSQASLVQHLGHLPVQFMLAKQAAGNVHCHKRQLPAFGLPLHHLPTGLAQHPGVDFGNQPGALGNRDELARRHQAALGVLPAYQCLDPYLSACRQVMYRLEVGPQLILLQCPAQLTGGLDPVLGVSGQLFGVQRIAGTPVAFGLVQRRIGITQQLLGAQGVAGEQADTDAGTDEQAIILEHERLAHAFDNALRQLARLADLLAVLGQHTELVATQACQGHAIAQHLAQALAHQL
ncbi:hypothetical protein D3C81_1133100 [compost metagenome]